MFPCLTNEKAKDFYQCIVAFFTENFLTIKGGMSHHGERVESDEELSPSIENLTVFLWI